MSYATIRAAILAKLRTALGSEWTVEVGVRTADVDLEEWRMPRVCLLISTSFERESIVELGGEDQEAWLQWSVVYGVRYQQGREAEADLIIHAAMESVATGLKGDIIDETCGPLERTSDSNLSAETVRLTWSQGWRQYRYPS